MHTRFFFLNSFMHCLFCLAEFFVGSAAKLKDAEATLTGSKPTASLEARSKPKASTIAADPPSAPSPSLPAAAAGSDAKGASSSSAADHRFHLWTTTAGVVHLSLQVRWRVGAGAKGQVSGGCWRYRWGGR